MRRALLRIAISAVVVTSMFPYGSGHVGFAQSGTWTAKAPLPNPRVGPPTGVIGGKLYIAGGCCAVVGPPHTRFTDMRIYDPSSDTWSSGPPIPSGVYGAGSGVIGDKLYVAGGQVEGGNINALQIYDAISGTWSTGQPLPEAGSTMAAGVINGKLYVVGGNNAANTANVNTLRIYDPQNNLWTTGAPMPTARAWAAAAVLDGKLYVAGGQVGSAFSTAVEAYDPVSNSWSIKPPLPTARFGLGAAVVQGILYAVGGYNGTYLNIVEAYDPLANAWSTQDPMPNVHYSAGVAALGDRLHVVSGADASGVFHGAHDVFIAPTLNTPPTANAGPDQAVRIGAVITLDGSASFDDNTVSANLQYAWSFVAIPSGSAAVLNGANTATPTFEADLEGNYVAQLTVTDEGGLHSVPDEVVVGTDVAPTADAGADQMVVVGTSVSLNGSGFDPDGDALTFSWALVTAPVGSGASLSGAGSPNASFTPDLEGTYTAALTVSDLVGPGTPDTVQITAVSATDYAQLQIQSAAMELANLTANELTTEGNRRALMNFLSQAVRALQADDVGEASNKLHDAIARTDGCALRGSPDGNGSARDWVTTCDAQQRVYAPLVAALAALQ